MNSTFEFVVMITAILGLIAIGGGGLVYGSRRNERDGVPEEYEKTLIVLFSVIPLTVGCFCLFVVLFPDFDPILNSLR